tara:strand:+ start:1116 stop:1904 length:789 start_codon:yes stop_codon:yes gene_type:complete
MSRLLVCPPDYYGIEYEINPWMRISDATDSEKSKTQWYDLMKTLEDDVGVELERMIPIKGWPDLVFTANAGVAHNGIAVISKFKHPERQGEEKYFKNWFTEHGYKVVSLEDGSFEGAGDLLGFDDIWFGGYGQRSDKEVYTTLSDIYDKEIIPLKLVNEKFYHLDTCFCPLSGGELLYYPPAFDLYSQKLIAERRPFRVIVSSQEAERFACNAVCVGNHVVLPSGCDETMKVLKQYGYITHPVELNEFFKSGGSAKCLTFAL